MSANNKRIYPSQVGVQYFGTLQIQVICELGSRPVENATVKVFSKNEPNTIMEILSTDISGKTIEIELSAPPVEYSMEPIQYKPYSEYELTITAPGLQTVLINGVQILPKVKTIQHVTMPHNFKGSAEVKKFIIGPNFLYDNYPPKIYEDEIKAILSPGEIKPIVIPEFIIIHDGIPSDITAKNYYIEYKEYIKNVASGLIYATWSQETIYANILTILSFSLNRIYTNWYPRQGYNFTITSSTSYDQIWFNGRSIYCNISLAVDHIFNYFLSRPDILQPILTQSCLEAYVTHPNMLSLWGSKILGEQGFTAIDILHHYYGNTIYVGSTNHIAGITLVCPNMDLTVGSSSEKLIQIQKQLDILSHVYYEIPPTNMDGTYGEDTAAAVSAFQKIFDLPVTGIINTVTWYKISHIYARITRASDLYVEVKS